MEDQIRRMILAGNGNTGSDIRPVVRLPTYTAPQYSDSGDLGAKTHGPTSVQDVSMDRLNLEHCVSAYTPELPLVSSLPQAGPQHLPPHVQQGRPHGMLQHQVVTGHQYPSMSSQPQALPPHVRAAQRNSQRLKLPLDPNAFSRGSHGDRSAIYPPQDQPQRQLFDPSLGSSQQQSSYRTHQVRPSNQHFERQSEYLNDIATAEIQIAEMAESERRGKESFRIGLQEVISDLCEADPERFPPISLECFGSFRSGFASRGSDMDLAIVSEDQSRASACFSLMAEDLPRALEKRLLELGYGARLLTRTRVPIIKICEKPGPDLLANLREEREKWNALSDEKKYPHLYGGDDVDAAVGAVKPDEASKPDLNDAAAATGPAPSSHQDNAVLTTHNSDKSESRIMPPTDATSASKQGAEKQAARQRQDEKWTRERKSGPLDFPKDGIGIQSDINFFNPLGLHNTQMLRNYSLCDRRVRPMVLFVKAWAKRRMINSSYSGTLSSYGYVLMVLHYLINIAQPAVLPNLQSPWRPNPGCAPPGATRTEVDNWVVDFWRSEVEIVEALQRGQMSNNNESIASLLVGFFSYFSSVGGGPQFHWMKDVLSLRTPGGILSKEGKGWVKALTEESEGRKVQQRYLFCIEDPFELSHNVARTVTHHGIVAIRDEFRRAKRILLSVGNGIQSRDGMLMDALVETDGLENKVEGHNVHQLPRTDHTTQSTVAPAGRQALQHAQQTIVRNGPVQKHGINGSTRSMQRSQKPSSGLNVMDDTAFPSLGGSKSVVSIAAPKQHSNPRAPHTRKKQAASSSVSSVHDGHNHGEISGDRAKALVAEVKRKNAEAAAESIAKRAAEAVLGDDD